MLLQHPWPAPTKCHSTFSIVLFLSYSGRGPPPQNNKGVCTGARGKGILPGREGFQSMKAQQAQTVRRGFRRAGRQGFCATKAGPQCFGSGTGVGRLCVHELTSLGRCPHSCCLECRGTLTLELECLVLPVTCSAWQFHLGMLLPTDRHCLPTHF